MLLTGCETMEVRADMAVPIWRLQANYLPKNGNRQLLPLND
jgi:hypothetical protein